MSNDNLDQFRTGMADQLRREFAELTEPDFMDRVKREAERPVADLTDDEYLDRRGGAW